MSARSMAAHAAEDNEPIAWPLQYFYMGRGLPSANSVILLVDRATHEFGVIHYNQNSVATVERLTDTDELAFFSARHALAACWHSKSKKVSILQQHTQIDLIFHTPTEAREFLDTFEDAAATTQNSSFCSYEHSSIHKFMHTSFDMAKENIAGRTVQPWMDARVTSSEWTSLRKSGEWSDFTIVAGGKSFAAHRVKLCKESDYFKAICNGGFLESNDRSIKLPESEQIIEVLLYEVYDTYNSTTGSLFTGFVLRSGIEKERLLSDLLELFIAADKYNLEKIKTKVAKAIIDRMAFVQDVITVIDLAISIFDEQCPHVDRGLRKAIITQIHDRMPAIINDQTAWQEYSGSKVLLKALHTQVFNFGDMGVARTASRAAQCASPPATPTGAKRRRTS